MKQINIFMTLYLYKGIIVKAWLIQEIIYAGTHWLCMQILSKDGGWPVKKKIIGLMAGIILVIVLVSVLYLKKKDPIPSAKIKELKPGESQRADNFYWFSGDDALEKIKEYAGKFKLTVKGENLNFTKEYDVPVEDGPKMSVSR